MSAVIPSHEFTALRTLLDSGRYADLEKAARALSGRYPEDGRGWQMLGVSFLARGAPAQALPPLGRAAELMPDNPAIWDNLGLTRFRCKDYAGADACFQRSTRLQPDRLTAWVNWSASACAAGEALAAEHHAREALRLAPRLADGWLNLGNALADQDRWPEAAAAYRQCLALRPDWSEAELSLGMLLDKQGQLAQAMDLFAKAALASPADWRIHANLGKVHSALGRSEQATASYRRAVQCEPDALEAHSGLLFLRLYEEGSGSGEVFADHCAFGRYLETRQPPRRSGHGPVREASRRLRVGFVSGDFREHAVAHFFEPCLARFDRRQFDIVLYSSHPVEDAVSERLRAHAGAWVKVARMSDDDLAARIEADGIDILVDLAGHSSYNRLPVFAMKPAPVQVSWLGYPATTGLSAIDYRPVYQAAAPAGILDDQFVEKLVYLPCGPSFRHPPEAPAVGPLPALCRGGVTFASLNRSNKLGDAVIRAWGRILAAVPSARLLIGAVGEAAVRDDLLARFGRLGIGTDRLDFRPRLPMRDYLALHNEIDILLDTFPFSGLTTSEHALWMGVPVLTLAGDALVKRQGAAVMEPIGLADWVTASEEEYVARAVAAAADLAGLATLRRSLRDRLQQCPTVQPAAEARCLEAAFREMWRRWCAGLPPESFTVTL